MAWKMSGSFSSLRLMHFALVVADEGAVRVGGEGRLAGAGEAEEDGGVAVLAFVGGAVHSSHAAQREEVVHHGEDALLHLAAVPGAADEGHALGEVEGHEDLAVQTHLLPVGVGGLAGVQHHEVGLEIGQFLLGGADEHVLHEMGLPSHLRHEADLHAGVLVGAAVSVHHIDLLARELFLAEFAEVFPGLVVDGFVVGALLVGVVPPNVVFRVLVHDDVFVFGRAAGEYAGIDREGARLGQVGLLIARQCGVGLMLVQLVVRQVVIDFNGVLNAQGLQFSS